MKRLKDPLTDRPLGGRLGQRPIAFLAIVGVVFGSVSALAQTPADLGDRFSADADGEDAGGARSSAMPIAPGIHEGNLTQGTDDRDVFAFEVQPGQAFGVRGRAFEESSGEAPRHVRSGPLTGDVEPTLISPDGERFPVGSDHWAQPGRWFSEPRFLARAAEPVGTWFLSVNLTPDPLLGAGIYFGVYATVPASPHYQFELATAPRADQDDAGSGRDTGDASAPAVGLPDGISNATAGPADAEDVYTFEAEEGSFARLTVRPSHGLAGWVEVGPRTTVAVSDSFGPGRPGTVVYKAPDDGTQRVKLSLEPAADGLAARPYKIELQRGADEVLPCAPLDDASSGRDAPEDHDRDTVALGAGNVTGCLSEVDLRDIYHAHLERGEQLRLEIGQETCERAQDEGAAIEVDLVGVPEHRSAVCPYYEEERSLSFTAYEATEVRIDVEARVDGDAIDYTLDVDRQTVSLPVSNPVDIVDSVPFRLDTPATGVPVGNVRPDTEALELRRQCMPGVVQPGLGTFAAAST